MKKTGSFVQQPAQFIEMFVALDLFGRALLERHAGSVRQHLQGGHEVQAVMLHDEVENVAALATCAKTAPVLAIGEDNERWRFLGMEWAKRGVIAPRLFKLDILRQEVYDVKPRFDLVGDRHSCPPVTSSF